VREVAVQGTTAAKAVSNALTELDAIDDVDVIVVARGGGSFEDLLPFSDEKLIRLVATIETPIVSAIGHEENKPLLDYVADFRASTPTDAARKIVPDVREELSDLLNARLQLNHLMNNKINTLRHQLDLVLSRPALAHPGELITQRLEVNQQKRQLIFSTLKNKISIELAQLTGLQATLRALSPQGTLERGYAIVRDISGQVISSALTANEKESLLIKFADGTTTVKPIN
jgi:exodeoxyribonuclease VII large subunit